MNLKEFASENKPALLRSLLIFAMVVLVAALRLAPHPWNFTPVGAIAGLFGGGGYGSPITLSATGSMPCES